ncbi:MAG: hemerythrin domain-containing protein [Acidobacteriota bacterium]
MKPTQILKDEHETIKLMLEVIENVCLKLEAGDAVPADDLLGIVDFISGFADRCHHAKEEDLLYPAMEESGVPRQGGPIGVMLAEHAEGREYVKNMKAAAAKYGQGDREEAYRFAENARNYTSLLSQHIDKENNILYMIADQRLSTQTQAKLEKEFERMETEIIGPGKHEEYHGLLEKLEKAYC